MYKVETYTDFGKFDVAEFPDEQSAISYIEAELASDAENPYDKYTYKVFKRKGWEEIEWSVSRKVTFEG